MPILLDAKDAHGKSTARRSFGIQVCCHNGAVRSPTLSALAGSFEAVRTLRLSETDILPLPSLTFEYEPRRPGARPALMDVYEPRQSNQRWMLLIHGGGFTTGSRNMKPSRTIAAYFLARGWLVYSADYPLARVGGVKLPEQRASVENAVRSAAHHARVKHGLEDKGVLVGSSAGATLALLASENEFDLIETVVSCFGLYDFAALEAPLLKVFRGLVLGSGSQAAALEASPAHRGKRVPQTLLLHGTADLLVPYEQAGQMESALRGAGVASQRFDYAGAPHAFFNDRKSAVCQQALADIDRALNL